MEVVGDRLYIGTFDWSQLARVGALALVGLPAVDLPDPSEIFRELGSVIPVEGGDLYWIQSKGSAAKARAFDGVDNATNYGVRTMVNVDGVLYAGTANAMNLHPKGGWELIEITPKK